MSLSYEFGLLADFFRGVHLHSRALRLRMADFTLGKGGGIRVG
jgi:hypothetical protein